MTEEQRRKAKLELALKGIEMGLVLANMRRIAYSPVQLFKRRNPEDEAMTIQKAEQKRNRKVTRKQNINLLNNQR